MAGKCAFCSLPDKVRVQVLAQWHGGTNCKRLADWLNGKGFGLSLRQVEYCLNQAHHHGDRGDVQASSSSEKLGKIVELLERSNIDPADISQVKTIRLSQWEGLTKNAEGEAEVHKLEGASIVLTPAWDDGPRWVPIDRGKPVIVKPHKASGNKSVTSYQTAVVLPDTQIGYYRDIDTGALTPFHDEAAIAIALEVIRLVEPDVVVLLGDYLDFAPLSDKFQREAGFALTIQPALDYGVELLGKIRALVPEAKMVLIEGNHDRRLQKSILNNNLDCFGVKRGMSAPDSWPVFSVPYLLRLDELDVEYIGGYPAGEFWLSENLVLIHGRRALGGERSTAAAVIQDERVSIIQGHTHHIEQKHKTRRVRRNGVTVPKQAQAVSLGCLSRIDGVVPSVKGATDVFGKPIVSYEDWQQACGVVTFEPGDGPFGIEIIPIYPDGVTFFRGKEVNVA